MDHKDETSSTPMREDSPLVSVIIPTLNRAAYLERCLKSVLEAKQTYPKLEIIVIDGGSSDTTPELLKKYDSEITYWVSERDSGTPEAANKGVARAHGELLQILGDDDELLPSALEPIVDYFNQHPEVGVVFGDAEYLVEDASGVAQTGKEFKSPPPGELTLKDFLKTDLVGYISPEQQFTRRQEYERFGVFDPTFLIWSGFELWCRFVKQGVVLHQVATVVIRKRFTPVSGTVTIAKKKIEKEEYRLLAKHGGLRYSLKFLFNRKIVPVWYRALKFTRPLRHPLKALRGE